MQKYLKENGILTFTHANLQSANTNNLRLINTINTDVIVIKLVVKSPVSWLDNRFVGDGDNKGVGDAEFVGDGMGEGEGVRAGTGDSEGKLVVRGIG